MKRLYALLVMIIFPAAFGCQAQIPIALDYGMSRRQMEHTQSVAYLPARSPDVHVNQYASNGYSVGLSRFKEAVAKQKGRDYCWAACVEMVSRYNGHTVSQEEVVRRIRGKTKDGGGDAGSVIDIVRGLAGPWRTTYVSNGISNWIVQDLLFDSPVIVGLKPENEREPGHVVVLTAAAFSLGPRGEVIAHEFAIYDPADGRKHDVEADELRTNIDFVLHFRSYDRM